MPRGSLVDASAFLAAQAQQLAMLSLLIAINNQNMAGLQADATRSWQKASSGWRQANLFGASYLDRKQEITGSATPGVLSGGWRAFRTLATADIVLSQGRRGLKLNLKASNYTARELSTRREYQGNGNIPKKPWRNYPQRFIDLSGIPFSCKVAASIRGSRAATIREAQKELPLNNLRINWRHLGREGRRIGTIRRQRVKIQNALARALDNAV